MNENIYDADYFLHGKESGKSLYENYHWMPELTIPMVQSIVNHLGIEKFHSVLDFGCARGYTVKAFRQLEYEAYGIDVSEWAIDNCDDEVRDWVWIKDARGVGRGWNLDWIIAKDVLEHVPQVADTITELMNSAKVGVFVVVPLSANDGQPYVVTDYEKDVTHVHRLTLASWARMFMRVGWRVEAMHRIKGVKDNYQTWENGNGFIVARRI